jgi:subtilisin family serine protease
MSRKDPRKISFSVFAAHVEQLEDRRVMSADPLLEHQDVSEPPALEQTVQTGTLGDPDFWIDAEDAATFDDYFQEVEQALVQAHNLTGWYNVQSNYGFTGRGQTVAVIDSGIAYNHYALGGGVGANYRVVGGWDFTEENEWNFYDDASGGHGTHVSGIIGGSAAPNTGVAPGVDFVGLRVFNDTGAGYFSWVENALKWVLQNRNSFENPITTINLSMGVSSWNAATIPQWANLEDEFAALESAGIFIAVSAGNSFASFNSPGLSYPAASQYVVPVMSADDSGSLSYFSQRLTRAIAAPGRNIVSTIPDYKGNNNGVADDYATMSGTSMAAPYVAGAAVIIRQAMQFVGMTNITQDMIFNHMMANADTVFDSATNLSYKRLNLQKAVDALMPSDDYGSTSAAAHNLGTLSGSTNVSGAIGKISDADYFRFTAGTTGNVTFNVTSSQQELAASWQAYAGNGAVLATQNGNSLSFAVTAGQTYSLRLTTAAGVGKYAFTASTVGGGNGGGNVQPSFTDWGVVDYGQYNDVVIGGERWLRVEAARTGLLTVLGQNASANGASVSIYNSNMQLVAGGVASGSTTRSDVQATAGAEYFIRVTGSAADVDLTIVNLVSQSGLTVTVAGTNGNDAYSFSAGGTQFVTVNGIQYQFAANAANQFNFQGSGGADVITLVGSSGSEIANLYVGSSTIAGAAYAVSAVGFETQYLRGGGGVDIANLYDSNGNDTFTAWADRVVLAGVGYANEARDFDNAKAFATAGGIDTATFYDTSGNDVFIAGALRAVMGGNGYFNWAEGFDSSIAYATAGGYDQVEYYDSAGNDSLTAWSDRAAFSGQGFSHDARGFERAKAFSIAGGVDQATFYDSAGDDIFIAGNLRAILAGVGFWNEAEGFDSTIAHATAGGTDRVEYYDTAGDETVTGWADRATIVGAGFSHDARGFERTTTFASGGYDVATFYDSIGNDILTARPTQVTMSGSGYSNEVRGFDKTKAISAAGDDQALFYDSAGNDTLYAGYVRAVLTGAGYWNEAEGFDNAVAYSTAGGYDNAEFYGSAGDDVYTAWSTRATLTGLGYFNEARNFEKTKAWSGGGNDQAVFYDSIGNDTVYAGEVRAILMGSGFWNEAEGFARTATHCAAGGNDKAFLYGSSGNDSLTGTGATALLQGTGFRHELNGLDSIAADMSGGGSDNANVSATDYLFSIIGQ